MKSFIEKSHWSHFLILLGIIIATYANSLHNDFMIDDHNLILGATATHQIKFLSQQFIPDINSSLKLEDQGTSLYYRPIAHIFPSLEWLLFGKNVLGYHLTSLFLFYLCTIAIFYLINGLFNNNALALLVSLLYAAHPLNGLYINYITASVFAWQMLALIGAFILFWYATEQKNPVLLIALSLLCFFLSLLCHESSLALPLYLTASVIILKNQYRLRHVLILLPYYFFALAYFIFRLQAASFQTNLFDKLEQTQISLFQVITSNIRFFFYYLSKFVYFDGIVIKLSMPPVTTGGLLWVTLFTLTIALWIHWYRKNEKILAWGGAILLIGFIPVVAGSSFEIQHGWLMFEPHWVFFPSLGMFIIISLLILKFRKFAGDKISFILIALILLNMIAFNRQMNKIWGDEIAYCRYWSKYYPQDKGPIFNLAAALKRKGKQKEAKETYRQSLEGGFLDWTVYTNLALLEQEEGNLEQALQYHLQALRLFPESTTINNNLGIVSKMLNQKVQAESYFNKAIKYNPYIIEPYLNLASLYLGSSEYQPALELYQKAQTISPRDENSMLGELHCLILLRDHEKTVNKMREILQGSHSAGLFLNAAIYLAQDDYEQLSLMAFEKALMKDPKNTKIYEEAGKFYANKNQFDSALTIWNEGLKLDSNNQAIKMLIEKGEELKKAYIKVKGGN